MSDIAASVGSPMTATIGGKDWTLSPLSVRAIGRMAKWRRNQAAKELLFEKNLLNPSERKELIKEMLAPVDMSESMTFDIDSMCYLLWLAATPNHPNVTFEDFADQIKMEDMEQLNVLAGNLFTGGDLDSLEDANADDPPAAEAGKE